jgi:hypothetical protein
MTTLTLEERDEILRTKALTELDGLAELVRAGAVRVTHVAEEAQHAVDGSGKYVPTGMYRLTIETTS